jgi:hypothetical protein
VLARCIAQVLPDFMHRPVSKLVVKAIVVYLPCSYSERPGSA